MLLELSIENFVLIKSAGLNFSDGFTVVTGETGAGKSLAVQALKLVLGARADTRQVRPGEKQAVVQALFTGSSRTEELLEERGIDPGEELIIRRIIPTSGRGGRIYVNGSLVSLQDLRDITSELVSISSQHEYQTLLKKGSHRIWLDRFAGLEADVCRMTELYSALSEKEAELRRLVAAREGQAEEQERLNHEAELIDGIQPVPGEVDKIEQELSVLRSAKELRLRGENVYSMLYAGKGAVLEILSEAAKELERMARADARLEKTLEELQSVRYQAEEAAWQVRDYVQALPADMSRLEQLEDRLYSLRQLKRRFGPGIEDVLAYRQDIEQRLADASGISQRIRKLQAETDTLGTRLLEQASSLSEKRIDAARKLSEAVCQELADLKLQGTDFVVDVEHPDIPGIGNIGPAGFDTVSFMFSANAGQAPAPLARIASGGELSRVMLALKAVLARKSGIETVIFDELDAGISGEVAEMVGRKLSNLSRHGQVVAISHYPQIAAAADLHISVDKAVQDGLTTTEMKELQGEERVEEIARMLGGGTEDARAWAARLLGPVLRGA